MTNFRFAGKHYTCTRRELKKRRKLIRERPAEYKGEPLPAIPPRGWRYNSKYELVKLEDMPFIKNDVMLNSHRGIYDHVKDGLIKSLLEATGRDYSIRLFRKDMTKMVDAAAGFTFAQQEKLFEVERILGERERLGRTEYLIAWKGYGPEERSWEPASNLVLGREALLKEWSEFKVTRYTASSLIDSDKKRKRKEEMKVPRHIRTVVINKEKE